MDIFMSTSSCRSALQRVYWGQRRTWLSHATHYAWQSPVLFKLKQGRGTSPLPPSVTTLDPRRISDENFFDISVSSLSKNFLYRKLRSVQLSDPHHRQFGGLMQHSDVPFPPDIQGFLYYYSVPNQSPFGGGIRFRVAKTPDGFLEGHDLLMPHGLPWHIPIWEVCSRRRTHRYLCERLEADGFAPRQMLLAAEKANVDRDSVFITALGQPWVIDFQWEFIRIFLAAPSMHPVPALVSAPWFSKSSTFQAPFYGRGLVSIVPGDDGAFGLRVDKILKLDQKTANNRIVVPTEGSVTPLVARSILKQTKMSEAKMSKLVGGVNSALRDLPWAPTTHNPLDVYHYPPMPMDQLIKLGWAKPRPLSPPSHPPLSFSGRFNTNSTFASRPAANTYY
ncbi:hypothetical protein FB451DRAFT_1275240 [Mycena latifolia]|nr:hypothetical protein FB451DRAFT_1275240 [Mycena latifolia]